jgi:radical SAM superfamily enzyme YgiQ (UPF0313 family)
LAELEALVELGWRKHVFIVDDNFIGNHKLALELAREMEPWQEARDYPLLFFTEASIDLAQRPELIEAMVKANFFFVFIGIESPSKESLKEAKKFQNLRADPLECIRFIQSKGLWVTAGFIVGFDSDTEDIFEQQRDFIERAAIPWAMVGLLQAPPTTPIYDRMLKQGRLLTEGVTSNFNPPNFKTILPLPVLLKGFRETLDSLYSPSAFYDRAYRSLVLWKVASQQKASFPYNERHGRMRIVGTMIRSIFHQGIRSSYRKAYWTFFICLLGRWSFDPLKLSMGFLILISGHHFIRYARTVVAQLESELSKLQVDNPATDVRPLVKTFEMR